jgi:hypothetical protein
VLALEKTFQYLGREKPTYEEFVCWILRTNGGHIDQRRLDRIGAATCAHRPSNSASQEIREIDESPPVLTAEDLSFWDENGYVNWVTTNRAG